MKKVLSMFAVALLLAASSAAQAADGVMSSATLSALGLSGATLVSDSEASLVRGHGYHPNSIAIAAGGSFAHVGGPGAGAGSVNVYFAAGQHFAGGANLSVAGKSVTHTKEIGYGHHTVTVSHTKSVTVFAGGFSAAAAF